MEIKDRALFISDSHFDELDIRFLASIRSLEPSQIFFMGDIFNLFIPRIGSSRRAHERSIRLLNSLSGELFYFCGNHDFGIAQEVFPRMKIFPRQSQPALFFLEGLDFKVYLAHGDLFISKKYETYISLMTSKTTLCLLDALDFISLGLIYKIIEENLRYKEILSFDGKSAQKSYVGKELAERELDERNGISFEERRKRSYLESGIKEGLIIEGHFHREFKSQMACPLDSKSNLIYLALPSLYCQKSVVMYQSNHFKEIPLKVF